MTTDVKHASVPATTGRRTGLAAGTQVLTMKGSVAIETLKAGDRIITRDGMRTLRAVTRKTLRGVHACIIRQDALGNARPEHDITVAPDQPILLRDWRAKALYGQGTAMVEARRLVDGTYISRTPTATDIEVFSLDLGGDHVIYAGGLELGLGSA